MADFIIIDDTHVQWPGVRPYRGPKTRKGRGYKTQEEAARRVRELLTAYAARVGSAGSPRLRVVERT